MAFPQPSDYRPPIIPDGEIYDNPENGKSYYWTQILLPEGSTPDTAETIGGYWSVICEGSTNKYVKITGDTMTGDLVIDDANIKIDNGNIEFEAKGGTAYIQDPDNRFAKLVSRSPKDTDLGSADYGNGFGIKVDIGEGNTWKNRFIVANQHGDIATVFGGTGPAVTFGTKFPGNDIGWDDDQYKGSVIIKGIPTPAYGNPEKTIAVNKEYVDKRDDEIRQDILELEEEIDAIAPTTQRGEWHFDKDKNFPDPGDYYLVKGASSISPAITEFYNEADGVVFHNEDANGVVNTWSNVAVGELIQIFDQPDPDFVLGTITNVDTSKIIDAVWIEFDRISAEGSPNNNATIKLSRINIFEAPSGGNASEFVLKSGDTMTGELKIVKDLQAAITLSGKQDDLVNPVATIAFNNQKDTGLRYAGYLSYRNSGTTSDGFFRFNRNLEIQGTLKTNSISVYSGDTTTFDKRLDFTQSSNVNARFQKGFVVKKTGEGIGGANVFGAYDTHVEYDGPVTDEKHIVNKKYADTKYVNAAGGTITITKSGSNYYIT